jgi:hypothetical protein
MLGSWWRFENPAMNTASDSEIKPSIPAALHFFLLSYAYLATLALVSWQINVLNLLWFGLWMLVLSTFMMLALWHQSTIRRHIFSSQFQQGTFLYRWSGRRVLSILLLATVAVIFSGLTLFQAAYFGWPEWALLSVSPIAFRISHLWILSKTESQFSKYIYALRWTSCASQALFLVLLTVLFLCISYINASPPQVFYLDRVFELQSQSNGVQSSFVKWFLDAGAFGQAAQETITSIPEQSYWKIIGTFFLAPLTVFSTLALTYSGMSLSLDEFRRTIGNSCETNEKPSKIGPVNSAVWTAIVVVLIGSYFQLLAYANQSLKAEDSPFAIRPMQPCEKIDGVAYQVNTLKTVESLIASVSPKLAASSLNGCQELTGLEANIASGVDDYLNWYFSLGADYARLAMILAGDVDIYLSAKFNEIALKKLHQDDVFMRLQAEHEGQLRELYQTNGAIQKLLSENRLMLVDRSCKVVGETSMQGMSSNLESAKTRLSTSAAAGLIGGVFASKLTAKVMAKSTFKLSGKVLLKAIAKKAGGKAGGALAGAAAGAGVGSLFPVVGTAIGAAIGAVTGLVVGVAIDIAALGIEEGLTRDAMKKDLLDSVAETLRPMRETFGCK